MPEPLTNEYLAEIKAREQAATPGPWGPGPEIADVMHPWEVVRSGALPPIELEDSAQGRADAAFITSARADVPALLAEVERLRAELAEIRTDETDVDWLAEHVRTAVHYVLGEIEPRLDDKVRTTASERAALHIKAGSIPFINARVMDLAVDRIKLAESELDQHRAEHNEFLEDLLKFVPEAYEDDAAAEGIIATWVEDQAKGNERTLRAMAQELSVRQDLMTDIEAKAEAGRDGNDPANVLDDILHDIRRTRLDIEVFTPKPAFGLGDIESRVLTMFADADNEGIDLNRLTIQELTEMVTTAIRGEEATPS